MSRSFRKVVKGFSLVELAVVIVIIGVLAAFGVPRFIKAVERSKAAEAFAYLSSVRSAQERYHAKEGTYCSVLANLDIQAPTPKYFTIGTTELAAIPAETLETSWTLTLTRQGRSAGYGLYTVTFTQDGYDNSTSALTIGDADHLEINPVGGVADSSNSA